MKNLQKHLLIKGKCTCQRFKTRYGIKTKILENNDVMIDNQFIEKINGLKLELDLKKGAGN